MIPNNLRLVRKTWDKHTAKVNVRARAARDEMMAALIQLSKEEIKGKRPKGQRATPGAPPMNRTGNLRRSIRGEKFQTGFATYTAIVGPTIEYARAVELGGAPTWPKGLRFPYMEPAYRKFLTTVQPQIIEKYFRMWY